MAAFSLRKRKQLFSQDLLTANYRHKKSAFSFATIIISCFLILSTEISYADNIRGDFQDFSSNQAFSIWVSDPSGYFGTTASPVTVQSALMDIAQGLIASPSIAGPYLKINQSTPQTVINGVPTFSLGILGGSSQFQYDVGMGNPLVARFAWYDAFEKSAGYFTDVGHGEYVRLCSNDSPFNALEIGFATDTNLTIDSSGNLTTTGTLGAGAITGTSFTIGANTLDTEFAYLDGIGAYVYRSGGTDVVVADGGTGLSSATAYMPIAGGTTTTGNFQSIATGTQYYPLCYNTSGSLPTFQILDARGGGTGQTSYAVGDLLYASTTTALSKLADVAVGSYLRSGGVTTAPLWSTLKLPNSATQYYIPLATSANTWGEDAGLTYNISTDLLSVTGDIIATATGTFGGATNTPQLIVKANASQTMANPLIQLKNSAGTEMLAISSIGANVIAVGSLALASQTNSGNKCVAVGYGALRYSTSYNNLALGGTALGALTTGFYNTAMGTNALRNLLTGQGNTAVGEAALLNLNSDQSYNTAIGYRTGFATTGSNSLMLGWNAGTYETGGNSLYIDALDRSTEALGKTTSLIYGTFNATATNQILTINGRVGILTPPTACLTLPAGTATAGTAPLKLTSGVSLTTAEAGALEFTTDDFFATITTGAARKAFILDNGARLTSGKIPIASTNGRLIDSPTPAANGTYCTGLKLTPVTGTDGSITITNGIITAITAAT